eukprot:909749-Prorocentrum_minimum.AAC.2
MWSYQPYLSLDGGHVEVRAGRGAVPNARRDLVNDSAGLLPDVLRQVGHSRDAGRRAVLLDGYGCQPRRQAAQMPRVRARVVARLGLRDAAELDAAPGDGVLALVHPALHGARRGRGGHFVGGRLRHVLR